MSDNTATTQANVIEPSLTDRPRIKTRHKPNLKTWLIYILIAILISTGSLYFILRALSPVSIAFPVSDHYHFRMQLVIDGQVEDFAQDKYQLSYSKNQCGVDLTNEPIHFHDFRDQVVHIHWSGRSNDPIQKFFTGNNQTGGITGGQVLKNYGLNLIGGPDDLMGYRLDRLFEFPPKLQEVKRFGKIIPNIPEDNKYWIYTGDMLENGKVEYRARSWEPFLWTRLEDFFGKESLIQKQRREVEEDSKTIGFDPNYFLQTLVSGPNVMAHGDGDGHDEVGIPIKDIEDRLLKSPQSASQTIQKTQASVASSPTVSNLTQTPTKSELETINNLLGNVVIFSQKDEPSESQIIERFQKLVPLDNSSCGG